MSQVDVVTRSPMRSRSQDLRARFEAFVKAFEWTWTSAVIFSLALTFFLLITMAVIPSFWMYYAEQVLGWGGPTDLVGFLQGLASDPLGKETLLQIRDAIAMGLTVGPLITLWIAASAMQNWRKRLRGGSGETRASGGYR